MKVFLCNPPTGFFLRDERCQIDMNTRVAENMREPIQLLYLAGLFQSFGYSVELHDYSFPRYALDDVCSDLDSFQPTWFYMETTQGTFTQDLNFIRQLAERGYCFKYILKAPFVDEDYVQEKLDPAGIESATCFFVTRDFEDNIKEICAHGDQGELSGVYMWRSGSVLFLNGIERQSPDCFPLDAYPIPPRHFLNKNDYTRPDTNEPIAYIYTAKGCPYPCIFCSAPTYLGTTINMRSVASVIAEIESCVNDHDIRNFFFRSDTFTFYKEWVMEFCSEIVVRGLDIRWGANSRVDKIDVEIVRAMKNAGCDIIGFGIESGCDAILAQIQKGITTTQIREAHAVVKSVGVQTFFHTIVGFPWDTHETIQETKRFLLEQSPDFIEVNVPYPLRGTALYAIAESNGLFVSGDLEAYSHVDPILKTFTLSPSDVSRYRKDILRSFYCRPGYVIKKLIAARNPQVMWRYLQWGASFIRKLIKS